MNVIGKFIRVDEEREIAMYTNRDTVTSIVDSKVRLA